MNSELNCKIGVKKLKIKLFLLDPKLIDLLMNRLKSENLEDRTRECCKILR